MSALKINPKQVICAIRSYKETRPKLKRELKGEINVPPLEFFIKTPSAITYNNQPVILPDLSHLFGKEDPYGWVHGEVELAVVVKRIKSYIPPEKTGDYIQGYTILNDMTQRNLFEAGYSLSILKSFPTFSPIGPRIVNAENIINPNNLNLTMKVNEKIVQNSNTRNLIYSIEETVSLASRMIAFYEGDIISTGTPKFLSDYRLKNGDVMEAEVEDIGILKNTVKCGKSINT